MRLRNARRVAHGWQIALLAICVALPGLVSAAEQYVGRRVSDVLDGLRFEGIAFIYNTEILSDAVAVRQEPRARSGLALAEEILAGHQLGLAPVAPGLYAVVAVAPSTAEPSSPKSAAAGRAPIEEVIVQTSRYKLADESPESHTFLTQHQVQTLPRLGDETLRAVQRLPGTAVNGFSGLASIRGGEPSETVILLDGLRLYEPFHLKHFFSPVSLLDSRLIDGMDVYLGGYPAMYGDRMSAIIDAHSVHPVLPRYYELGLSLFHASGMASAEFADDRGHALISARRSNLGDLVQFSNQDFGEPQYFDGFARIDYQFSRGDRASLSALLSRDRIDAIRESKHERASAEYRNNYVWATYDHEWNERASSRLIASFTDITNERVGTLDDPGRRSGRVDDQRFFHIAGLRLDSVYALDRLTHRFGAEVRRLEAEYEYSSDVQFTAGFPFPDSPAFMQTRRLVPSPHGYETSAYWDARTRIGDRWTAQLGLRLDTQTYDASAACEQWSPRLSVLYDLSPHTRVRASLGRYYQPQGINELQVEDGIDSFHTAQSADHIIFSVEHTFASGPTLRAEAYRKQYRHLSPRFENLFNVLVLLPEVEFDRVMIDPDSARAEGFELLLSWRPQSEWSGWFGYSWSKARDRIDGADVSRSWDQKHAMNLGIAWSSGPWSLTIADTWHTGWPTTSLTLSGGSDPLPQIVIGRRNAKRHAAYNSLDFRLQRTFPLAHGELDVFVEASNVTSRENPCCTEYEVRLTGDGYALEADRKNWLPVVPSIGVLWRYGGRLPRTQ